MYEENLARYEEHVRATYEDGAAEIAPLFAFDFKDQSGVSVVPWETGFILTWTDYVINDWTEFYPSLSVALARLSALIACGETGWSAGFTVSPDDFGLHAETLFHSTTTYLGG